MTATKPLTRTNLASLLERRAELADHQRVTGSTPNIADMFGDDIDEIDVRMQRNFPHIDARF